MDNDMQARIQVFVPPAGIINIKEAPTISLTSEVGDNSIRR